MRHGDFLLHVGIVHAPDPVLVPPKRGVDEHAPEISHRVRKADVSRAVDQDLLSRRGKGLHGRGHAAQHAVFIADVLPRQTLDAVAPPLPGEDAVEVFLAHRIVAQRREIQPSAHGVQNGRRYGEGHVRDPHGDRVKALVHLHVPGDHVRGDRIPPAAVENGGKVIFHVKNPP